MARISVVLKFLGLTTPNEPECFRKTMDAGVALKRALDLRDACINGQTDHNLERGRCRVCDAFVASAEERYFEAAERLQVGKL